MQIFSRTYLVEMHQINLQNVSLESSLDARTSINVFFSATSTKVYPYETMAYYHCSLVRLHLVE